MKKIIFTILLLTITLALKAQELNATVKINTPKLQQVDPKVFKTLQTDLTEFINNRKWTNDAYKQNEKIDCSIIITINEELSQDEFKAQVTIQSTRPVYKSNYTTTMLNYVDKDWQFQYAQFQPIQFSEINNNYNLTTLVAFYCYMIIALDYDSFTPDGGQPYYAKAQQLVSENQSGQIRGWLASESNRNRFWMVDNLTNSKFSDVHDIIYDYHRNGLDRMFDNVDQSTKNITSSIEKLKKIFDENPQAMITQLLVQAKSDELINLYQSSNSSDKQNIMNMLIKMDASNASNYKKISK